MINDVYTQIIERIVLEQERIIGPLAIDQANLVPGLHVDPKSHEIKIEGDSTEAVDKLVKQYKNFFGQAAVEVCKEAVGNLATQVPPDKLPAALR